MLPQRQAVAPAAAVVAPAVAAAAGARAAAAAPAAARRRPTIAAEPVALDGAAAAATLEAAASDAEEPGASLARHKVRLDESELKEPYKAVADSFAASQLRVLRADHLSSHRAGGVPAADATPEGAARIEAMQQMMLGWATDRAKPTAFDVCAAHAALVDGGGMLRTKPVRAGNTRFATPVAQVQKRLEELIAGLRAVSARTDLSDVAKAAWAGYNFLALHPFPDGNGRMARGLVNMVLARFGCPFVVGFAANEVQRAAYRTALVASHKEKDVRPFAALIKACVARGWGALESAWASKRAAAAQEAAGARQRSRARSAFIELHHLFGRRAVDDARLLRRRLPHAVPRACGSRPSTTCPQCRAVVPPEERPAPPPPAGRPNPGRVVQLFNGDPDDTTFIDDTTYEPSDDTTDFEPAEDTTEDEFEFDDSTVFDLQFATVEDDTTAEEEGATEDDTTEVAAEYDDTTAELDYGDDTAAEDDQAAEDNYESADDTTEEDDTTASYASANASEDDDTTAEDDDAREDDTTVEEEDEAEADDTTSYASAHASEGDEADDDDIDDTAADDTTSYASANASEADDDDTAADLAPDDTADEDDTTEEYA